MYITCILPVYYTYITCDIHYSMHTFRPIIALQLIAFSRMFASGKYSVDSIISVIYS